MRHNLQWGGCATDSSGDQAAITLPSAQEPTLDLTEATAEGSPDYQMVVDALTAGELIPFLGAGVNLADRSSDTQWEPGRYLPSAEELARHLAQYFNYRIPEGTPPDLLRVSQHAAVMRGTGPLYRRLHSIFGVRYPPTVVHRFLAAIPATLRARDAPPLDLIVTTNYDEELEIAFEEAGEPFDLVVYLAEGGSKGRFLHVPHGHGPVVIERPNEYLGLPFGERPVLLKIHGAVAPESAAESSFVITEDDYIDYLARMDINNPLPKTLAARMRQSGFLFLGYSMRDWNLRVILYRIWGEQPLTYTSWAIQRRAEELDRRFWARHGVNIVDSSLHEYVESLSRELGISLPVADAGG